MNNPLDSSVRMQKKASDQISGGSPSWLENFRKKRIAVYNQYRNGYCPDTVLIWNGWIRKCNDEQG